MTISKTIKTDTIHLFNLAIVWLLSIFCKKNSQVNNRLLVIRIDNLGDLVLFQKALVYLRRLYQNYKITLVASESCEEFANLILKDGLIDQIIKINRRRLNRDLIYRFKIFKTIYDYKAATAINAAFSRDINSDGIIMVSKAKNTFGFLGDTSNQSLKNKLFYNKYYTKLTETPDALYSEVEKNAYLINSLAEKRIISIAEPYLNDSYIDYESSREIIQKIPNNKEFIILATGAGAKYKIWPIERWIQVVDYLIQKNIFIILIGNQAEFDQNQIIKEKFPNQTINLSGLLTLSTIAGLLKKAKFYLGNDSGILHLACAVETPTLALLGGGHFGRFFPYGNLNRNRVVYDKKMKCKNDNWICSKNLKPNQAAPCIMGITTNQLKMALDDMLEYLTN